MFGSNYFGQPYFAQGYAEVTDVAIVTEFYLDSILIRTPHEMRVMNSTQYAQNRTILGAKNRDYFGDNKRTWHFIYNNLNATDYATLNTIYENYLDNGEPISLFISSANYDVTATVNLQLPDRDFSQGNQYLSDFTLVVGEV